MSLKFIKKKTIIKTFGIFFLIWIIFKLLSNDDSINYDQVYTVLTSAVSRPAYDINCDAIFEMNPSEIQKSKELLKKLRDSNGNIKLLNDRNFIFDQKFCPLFRKIRQYDRFELKENSSFPIAYSIVAHKDTEQLERLLRLIYHPQNIYCIHIDSKSSSVFKESIKSIADCFDNVFITSRLENVFYASFDRLQADLNCLNDLFNFKKMINNHQNFINKKYVAWKYFMNLASTEFPLRTSREIKKILRVYNGSNEIEIIKKFSLARIMKKWVAKDNKLYPTNEKKGDPPHNFKIVKGYAYIVISRKFAQYALYDQKTKDLIEWSKDTWSPDEWFWSTLQYNTQHFPESGFKDIANKERIETLSRFAGWGGEYKCKGKWRHGVCVFSVEDLPEMVSRHHFVVNKFLLDFDPISYQCMEKWYLQRERIELPMSMFFYCNFLRDHLNNLNCHNM
ncbi:beta-1-3-galactosyl-O-glycosyl-glyco beta-1-6-N-acetylglucosaminyltransferase 3-like [Brachionus plicatilis]|uniref:Beta-1-3-galactosyl-O-glycosyl-glyco beta-1-6-N-acetylglucosaminyltransferase 3-like n=1 Tax=Brachionus plicatilis TaxID=10195 RepID=A0A3M7R137_BRAPC|nr:beta-1-3-galactosyl-O-glycosyl-glyco beta-1-6-N-acetylglucosaminyltransferase 3-like [Brachionus plicatilis]